MKKRKLCLRAVIIGALCLMTGCRTGSVTETATENEEKTLDWYVNYSWFTTTWGGNMVSEAITEKTGTRINFIAPKGSEEEKLDAMLTSDMLPDFVTLGWWESEYQEMIDKGLVYDLKELADLYCPEFYDVIDEVTAKWYTRADGSLYAYPNSSYTPEDVEKYDNLYSNQNFLVRKDIYEALGCPDMTTPEGFMNAVRRAYELFPEVDGEPLIPIGADEFDEGGCNSFNNYLWSYLAVPYEKDGHYYDRTTDADYIQWLKVFRQMNEEGYLKNDIFIDKRTQLEDKIAVGRYFCLFYQSVDIANQQAILMTEHPERMYIAVDGPKNAAKDDPVLPIAGAHGWTVTMIPKTCQDPERAIKFLTYLISEEGQKMTYLGIEGMMYDMEGDKAVVKPEVLALLNTDRVAYDEKYGANNTYWMLQDNETILQYEYNTDEVVRQMKEYTMPYIEYTGQYDLEFSDSEEKRRLHDTMQQLWGSTLKNLLLAKSEQEFDDSLNQYIKDREAAGYETYVAAAEQEFARNKEKLGMTDETSKE